MALSLPSLDFFTQLVCLPARPVHSSLLGLSVTHFSKSILFVHYDLDVESTG